MLENTPGSRDTNRNSTAEGIPHSGVHGNEKPVYDFEGKSLEQALADGDLHVETDESGRQILVPNTFADYAEPTKSVPTSVYEPLTAPGSTEKQRSWKKWVAGVVGSTVLLGGGYAAYDATRSDERSVASASENSGESVDDSTDEQPNTPEQADTSTLSTEQLVGTIVDNDFEKLNARPTEALLERLSDPILVSEHSAEEAAVVAAQKIQVYDVSGDTTIDTSTGNRIVALTPESEMSGNEQLRAIFSSDTDVTSPELDWMRGTRANISHRLKIYGTNEQYNLETSTPEYATLGIALTPEGSTPLDASETIVTMRIDQYTNFEALDRDELFDHPEIDTNQTFYIDMRMVQEGDEWRVKSYTPTS